jgi:GNAT superfamily N-acetyltransferase
VAQHGSGATCKEEEAEEESQREADASQDDEEAEEKLTPPSSHELRFVEIDDPDAGRLLSAYFEELAERFGAFEPPTREALTSDAQTGAIVLAYDAGIPVACGSLRKLSSDSLEVKRMFVTPRARGHGWGRRILGALEERARAMGGQRLLLDTAASLTEAAALYLSAGYQEVPRYNDNPYAARWFEKRLG